MADDFFLSRWSRRKALARRGEPVAEPRPADGPPVAAMPGAAATAGAAAQPAVPAAPEPLPPVESLTPDSDFSAFMRAEVDPNLRRQALRTLFQDPRFNVMDGLDVYIDDYSRPDPIPAEWMGKLNQMVRLGDHREPDPEAAQAGAEAADAAAGAVPEPEGGAPVAAASEVPPAPQSDTGDAGDGSSEVEDSSHLPGRR